MGELPIIFLLFLVLWVAIIVCCRSFRKPTVDLHFTERARRREIIFNQIHSSREVRQAGIGRDGNPNQIQLNPIRLTTISTDYGTRTNFCEIHVPRSSRNRNGLRIERHPPPPFSTAYLVSSPIRQPPPPPPKFEDPPSYEESLRLSPSSKEDTKFQINSPVSKNSKDVENYI